MINSTSLSGKLAADVKDVSELRQAARQNSPEALKATAKQFEALFMNMVMKSMRDATPQDGIFDSQQSKMYTSMLDQQISQSMASRGIGLAEVLMRQLSNVAGPQGSPGGEAQVAPAANKATGAALERAIEAASASTEKARSSTSQPSHVRAFQERLGAHADEASRETGIPAKFMLGQAALESGWGKREIKAADGSASHNLFGI
jgi:flagellar protein FlgJ